MSSLEAIIYGIIQGISEFLPVSSSGHLALLPHVMKINDPGVLFDLMMHLGTAFAVGLYFKKDVFKFAELSFYFIFNRTKAKSDPQYFHFCNFIIATISTVIIILLIKDFAFSFGRTAQLIAFNLIFFGIILSLSDLKKSTSTELDPMQSSLNLKSSIIIGVMQSFAVFPGVSRSGITITGGRLLGLSRTQASSFSFLMSLPIIIAGIIKHIPTYMKSVEQGIGLSVMALGVFVSFIVGILTIHIFMKLVPKIGLLYFGIYRVIIGILVLYLI
jgi:undecaprenyl-diphosphatase